MAVLIGLLLILLSIGVVLYPFLKSRRPIGDTLVPDPLEELAGRRRAIYADIETLELERGLGNVDEEQYHQMLRGYRLDAASTFKEQEALESQLEEMDRSLEEEVQLLRKSRAPQQAQGSEEDEP